MENCSFSQTLKYSGNAETAGAIRLFEGNPRVAGKHVDLGAIECQGRPAFILIVR